MDINKALGKLLDSQTNKGSILILDSKGNKVYPEGDFMFSDEQIIRIYESLDDKDYFEWEYYSTAYKKSTRVISVAYYEDNKKYYVNQFVDASFLVGLSREVGDYSVFYKNLSEFQKVMANALNDKYYTILPVYLSLYGSQSAEVFWLREDGGASYTIYSNGEYTKKKNVEDEVTKQWMSYEENHTYGEKYICIAGPVNEHYCVVAVNNAENNPEALYTNIAKTYLENAINRAQTIYASEHDKMTGLYNKRKFMQKMEEEYNKLDAVAIISLDVNNLKQMNDTYGHEMGDKLLIKGGDSIKNVEADDVDGYRLGGDEFCMVACNKKLDEINDIISRWEEGLKQLNTRDDGINCVIAIGMAYGEGEYDLDELLRQADAAMYEDKKKKKKPGEEIR